MLVQILLSPHTWLVVILGFIVASAFHQILIDRFLRTHKLKLGFSDRLLLCRVPFWKATVSLGDVAGREARILAIVFSFGFLIFFALFLIGPLVIFLLI